MGTTRFSGPVLGSERAGGGLYKDYPVALAALPNARVYFEDFEYIPRVVSGPVIANGATAAMIQTADIGSPASATAAIAASILALVAGATDDTGRTAYLVGSTASDGGTSAMVAGLNFASAEAFICEFRFAVNSFALGNAYFVGFCTAGTAPLTTGAALAGADLFGIHITLSTAGVLTYNFVMRSNSTTNHNAAIRTGTLAAGVSSGYIRIGLRVTRPTGATANVVPYVNGVALSNQAVSSIANPAGMVPTFAVLNTESLAASTLNVDYMLLARARTA